MSILAFLVSVAFIPGWTGASIPTGWAMMSVTLPWANWKPVPTTAFHWLGGAFLLYVFASAAWAPRADDAINELWHWLVLALAFVLGSRLDNLRGFWRGLAIGVTISSVIAIAQWFAGPHSQFLPTSNWAKPPGLFFNDAVAGAVAAITIVGLASEWMWVWIPGCLPLLFLSQSRGAWVAVIGTYVAKIFVSLSSWIERAIFGCGAILICVVAWHYYHGGSDPIRLLIWSSLLHHLHWLGSGVGSSMSIYLFSTQIFHVEHAHNDYIQLLFEYGLGVVPLVLAILLLLEHHHALSWAPFVCCLILSCYFWVLEAPVTTFAFAVVAGALARDLHMAWSHGYSWGLGRVLRNAAWKSLASPARNRTVSFFLGPTSTHRRMKWLVGS